MKKIGIKTLTFLLFSKKINKIIWVSKSSLDDYYFSKLIKKKSQVLPNIIDESFIAKEAKKHEIKESFDLIFLGRLEYPKNPEKALEIIEELKKYNPQISLAIVGNGKDEEKIKKIALEKKLEKNVFFYGFLENPYPILKASKLLLMTSIYEGTPIASLEAQSLGKPIIATPVDGLKSIVLNDFNGFLSDNSKELCFKILEFLNCETYKKLSQNSKKRFKEINNEINYYKTIEEIYTEE